MASQITFKNLAILVLGLSLYIQGIVGAKIECENLNKDSCSFAISSTGKRCVLEKIVKRTGFEEYTCKPSSIKVDMLTDWIETDQCVEACGLDRTALGISSDSLLENRFTRKLCSHQCYDNCPNVVDLYFNLAVGEGVFLPKLCKVQGSNVRRVLFEIKSSGIVAPVPEYTTAPVPAISDLMEKYAPGPGYQTAPVPAISHLMKKYAPGPEYQTAPVPAISHLMKKYAPVPGYQTAPVPAISDLMEKYAPGPGYQTAPVPAISDLMEKYAPGPEYQTAPVPAISHLMKKYAPIPGYQTAPVPAISDLMEKYAPGPGYQTAPVPAISDLMEKYAPGPGYQTAPVPAISHLMKKYTPGPEYQTAPVPAST